MSFNLNELRAQRERIREHLAWLDRQIAQAEGKPEQPAPEKALAPTTAKAEPKLTATATASTAAATPEAAVPAPLEEVEEPAAVDIPSGYSPGGFDSNSRLGCILLAVLAVGLVIFLIFGLPELLYPDAPETDESAETIEP